VSADPLTAALGLALLCVGAVIVLHVAAFRWCAVQRRARTLVLLWGAGLIGEVVLTRALGIDAWRTGYGAVLVACAFLLYMPFYYTIAASFSVRMLVALAREPEGVALAILRARHPFETILDQRFATLVASGYACADGAAYRLTAKGVLVARTFGAVKRLWCLGPGG
jgi:hypothetical protein